MESKRLTKIVIVALALFSTAASAHWKDSFYTDDSQYHLKLNSTGFRQLIRLHKNDCHQIANVQLHIKSDRKSILTNSKKLNSLTDWPSIYGLETSHHCFYELNASGLNLTELGNFAYAIRITETNGNQYFFQGLKDSILPKSRIKATLEEWIYLGAFGATPLTGQAGVLFKVWEPLSEKVFLTRKSSNQNFRVPMQVETTQNYQHQFHFYVDANASLNDQYFYEFQKSGTIERSEVANNNHWSSIKVDPYAKLIKYDQKGGSQNGYIDPHAIVAAPEDYQWKNDATITMQSDQDYNNWILYQLWPLTFNPQKQNGRYQQGTFNDIGQKLNYIENLNVNAVEFLPINESRFHATWGYALDSLFLVAKEYGSRRELMQLIDQIHAKKMKVVFDVVINHINNNLLREPLSPTVQTSKYYGGTTDWGPRPDFKNVMVQKWILDALLYLKRDFHLDGFRFDMIKIVYQGSPGGYEFIQNFNQILYMESPRFFSTAEELPDNIYATLPRSQNGLDFVSQWNDKFKNAFERNFDYYRKNDRQVDLQELAAAIKGFSNHKNYSGEHFFQEPRQTVNYLGSHDFIGNKDPIIRLVSDYESYEWEGQNHFFKVRPLHETRDRESLLRSLHNDFTHALARTTYGVLFSKPGHLLFFQGEEVGNDINIENEWSYIDAKKNGTTPSKNVNIHKYVGSHKMLWEYVEPGRDSSTQFFTPKERKLFTGQLQFFQDLLKWRKDHPEISDSNPQYVDLLENGKVISYHLKNGFKEYLVIANFGHSLTQSWFFFPGDAKTWWKEVFNSASPIYSGLQNFYLNPISNLGGRHNQLRLAGPSTIIFEKQQKGTLANPLYIRGTFNNWLANNDSLLQKSSDHGDIYMSEIHIAQAGDYRFKIASQDWNYEIGKSRQTAQAKQIGKGQGYMSSVPGRPDVNINLSPGNYKFIFDIKTFKFSFIRL